LYLIFDLDDTLLNTTRTLGRKQLAKVASALTAEEFIMSQQSALQALIDIRERCGSGRDAIVGFCQKYSVSDLLMNRALSVYYNDVDPADGIEPMPGAIELLNQLKIDSILALVSIGKRHIQLKKLTVAGIDASIFDPLIIIEQADKGQAYREVVSLWQLKPQDLSKIVVIGDRYTTDIEPAQKLGMRTVMVGAMSAPIAPDARVGSMDELRQAIYSFRPRVEGAL